MSICTDQSFRICRCTGCSLIFVNPQPVLDPGADVHFHAGSEMASVPEFRQDKEVVYRDVLLRLSRLCPDAGRVLDVGCGFGLFLDQARASGWEPYGIDVSALAVDYARTELHLNEVVRGDLLEAGFPKGHFQAVTLWNVLEHVPDPVRTMREVHRILAPGGIAVVRVPNMVVHEVLRLARPLLAPVLARLGRKLPPYLGGISPPQHLYGFTPTTARALLLHAGFDRVDIVPAVPHGARSPIGRAAHGVGTIAYRGTGGRHVLSPALIAYAQREQGPPDR